MQGKLCVATRVDDEALLVHNYRIRSQYVNNHQQSICRQRGCYTFTSGATQAWIEDETGEERAGEAFLRGSQAGQAGGLIAIPISIALGSVTVRLPILLGPWPF